MNLGRYRRDLDSVMQSLVRDILAILLGVYRPTDDPEEVDRMVERVSPEITAAVRVARNRAHRIAVQQLIDECPPDRIAYIPDQRGYSQDAVEKVLRDNLRGPSYQATNKVSSSLVRHAEQAARDTIFDAAADQEWTDEEDEARSAEDAAVEDDSSASKTSREAPSSEDSSSRKGRSRLKIDWGDLFDEDEELQEDLERAVREDEVPVRPIGWARVMTGAETCAFCVMLASRPGAGERRFYTTADAAGGELAKAEYQSTALFVNRYHSNCDCIVVPVYDRDNWAGQEQADYLYQNVYLKALDGSPATGWRSNRYAENDVVKALEKWLKENGESLVLPAIREMV